MGQDDGEMDRNSPEFQAALRDHAKSLGVNPDTEPLLMGLVEEALLAELPEGWEQGTTDDGTLYYFNTNTEESIWEHPLDAHYRSLIQTKKLEKPTTTPAPTSATSVNPDKKQSEVKTTDVNVYSFDDISDDEDPNIQPPPPKDDLPIKSRRATNLGVGATTNPSTTASSTLAGTSTVKRVSEPDSSSLKTSITPAAATFSPIAATSTSTTSAFGRDRSWLLDDDETVPVAFATPRPSTAVATPSTTTSSNIFGSNKTNGASGSTSTSTSTASSSSSSAPAVSAASKAEDSKSWFTAKLFANRSDEIEPITPIKSEPPLAPTPAPAPAAPIVPSRFATPLATTPIAAGTGFGIPSTTGAAMKESTSHPVSSYSPTASTFDKPHATLTASAASSIAASTIGHIGAASTTGHNSAASAATPSPTTAVNSGPNPQVAELKKANDELQKTVTSLQSQLDKALNEAKEVHYLKMKITEHKTKLTEHEQNEKELQSKLQHAEQQAQKFQQDIAQLEQKLKEHDSKATTQIAARSTEQQKLFDEKQKILDKCNLLQSQLDQQIAKEKELISSLDQAQEAKKTIQQENLATNNGLKDRITVLQSEIENLKHELTLSKHQMNLQLEQFDKQKKLMLANEQALAKQIEAGDKVKTQLETVVDQLRKQIDSVNSNQQDQLDQVRQFQNQIHQIDREKQQLQSEIQQKASQQEALRKRNDDAQKQIDELTNQIQQQQQLHQSQHQKLLQEKNELIAENHGLKNTELFNLQSQLETLQKEKTLWQDTERKLHKEIQTSQQAALSSQDQLQQLQLESDMWKRKFQQEKQHRELCVADKAQSDQRVLVLEAEVASWQHSAKLEGDKQKFRLQELESQMAQKEYEALRAQERFQKAESWRQKENKRVEQRDLEILQLREELAQLKSRNLESENTVVIQNLRKSKDSLEATQQKLQMELESIHSQYNQKLLLLQQQHDTLKQQMELQIPQLAAISVNRTSEEWAKKCQVLTRKLQQQFELKTLEDNKATLVKWNTLMDEKKNWEQKFKQAVAESDFLRKEVQRIEENNKVLLDQLHTIRCYLTQRPLYGNSSGFNFDYGRAGAATNQPQSFAWAPTPSNGFFSNNSHCSNEFLSNQLGILHAHFQKLFGESGVSTAASTKDASFVSGLHGLSGLNGTSGLGVSTGSSSTMDHSARFEIPCSSPTNATIKSTRDSATEQVLGAMLDQALDSRLRSQPTEKPTLLETLDRARASGVLPSSCSAAAAALAVSDGGVASSEFAGQEVPNASIWYQKDYWRTKYNQ